MKKHLHVLPILLLILTLALSVVVTAPLVHAATPTPVAEATPLPAAPLSEDGKPLVLTDADFQQVISRPEPVLVFFWAAWCSPCRRMAPDIEQLADEFQGRAVVGTLDVDENQETPIIFDVSSIPTILLFKHGEPAERIAGVKPLSVLRQRLAAQLDSASATIPTAPPGEGGEPIMLTDGDFQAVISGPDPVLVFFWAAWCSACRRMTPILEEIANEMGSELVVGQLDVDENPETPLTFAVSNLPTLLLFKDGELIDRIAGFRSKSQLIKRLAPQVNSAD